MRTKGHDYLSSESLLQAGVLSSTIRHPASPQPAPHPHSDNLIGMIRAVLTRINEMIDSAWLSCQIMENVLKVYADVSILLFLAP